MNFPWFWLPDPGGQNETDPARNTGFSKRDCVICLKHLCHLPKGEGNNFICLKAKAVCRVKIALEDGMLLGGVVLYGFTGRAGYHNIRPKRVRERKGLPGRSRVNLVYTYQRQKRTERARKPKFMYNLKKKLLI